MLYCKKCLQPDTRPGIFFDENQVCYACLYEKQKKNIDWDARWQELCLIAEEAKELAKRKGSPYDCVVGVSGGKDSTFQAIIAKEKLGLRVLLVNSVPDAITPVGQHNINNLAELGFDMVQLRPNPQIARKLCRLSFLTLANVASFSEHALFASSFQVADKFDIPLILQGENPALTLGTCLDSEASDSVFNVSSFNTLKQVDLSTLSQDEFPIEELWMYKMPDMHHLQKKHIKAIWMQYYMKEWSQVGNADFAVARGLLGRMSEDLHDMGRYRRFTALDSDLVFINQMLKYLKLGFGFATDEACYDIREGRLSREDAIWYVHEYDGKCGQQYIDSFCKYIDISVEEFWSVVDRFVNKEIFHKDEKGKWQPNFTVGTDYI